MKFRRCLALLLAPFLCAVAFCDEWGLVLAGGGGKGAYQVGVWKALYEYGIAQQVTVMSGTSVGGLNSALFACVQPDEAERIWLEEVPGELTKDSLISQKGLEGIISRVPLHKLRNSYPAVCVTAVRDRLKLGKLLTSTPGSYAHRFWLNDEQSVQEMGRMLLATSAVPVICDSVKLSDGYWYIDGGTESLGGDNVPIDPLVEAFPGVKNIIVVYCADAAHIDRRIKVKDYDSRNIVEIIPSIETGGMFDGTANFSYNRIRLLMQTGYDDTVKILERRGLYPVSAFWYN